MSAKYSKFPGISDAMSEAFKSPVAQAAIGAAVPMGVGAAVTGAHALVKRVTTAREQARSYQDMMKLHPALRQADQGKVKRYFGTLSRFNPDMAKDPTVAGAWITNIVDAGSELDPMAGDQALLAGVKDLAGIRSQLSTAKDKERGRGGPGQRAEQLMSASMQAGIADKLEQARRKNEAIREELREWMPDDEVRSGFAQAVHTRMNQPPSKL